MKQIGLTQLFWSKVNPNAIIPSKRDEDAGYDLYACFTEDFLIIKPGEIKIIPTGIATAFSEDYVMIVKERGSTGSKGMAVRMGIIDSGYRNEILVGINNTSNKPIIIIRKNSLDRLDYLMPAHIISDYTIYPYEKAIAQAVLCVIPHLIPEEIPYNELMKLTSERMLGNLGDSNK